MNLQKTPFDELATVRIFAKTDYFMKVLMEGKKLLDKAEKNWWKREKNELTFSFCNFLELGRPDFDRETDAIVNWGEEEHIPVKGGSRSNSNSNVKHADDKKPDKEGKKEEKQKSNSMSKWWF